MKRVFISYSHADLEWLDQLRLQLIPLDQQGLITYWDDRKIPRGTYWDEQIQAELESADIAILLVSAAFLASKFIADRELPQLLERARAGQLVILSIILDYCQAAYMQGLDQIQALNSPDKPLLSLPRENRGRLFVELAEEIRRLAGTTPQAPRPIQDTAVPPPIDQTWKLIVLGGILLAMLIFWGIYESWDGPGPWPPGTYTPSSQYGQPATKP